MRPVDRLQLLVIMEKSTAVWKNFFGTIGARSRTSASGRRSLSHLLGRHARTTRGSREQSELDDDLTLQTAHRAGVEGDQLHSD